MSPISVPGLRIALAALVLFAGGGGLTLYYGEARDERILPSVRSTARFIWAVALVHLAVGLVERRVCNLFRGFVVTEQDLEDVGARDAPRRLDLGVQPLVFANVAFFEEKLQQLLASSPGLRVLIIDAVSINEIDASGELVLRDYYRRLTETGIHVLFTRVRRPILAMFEEARFYDDVSREFIHRNPADVYRHAWELISAGREEQPEAPKLEGPDEPKYQ